MIIAFNEFINESERRILIDDDILDDLTYGIITDNNVNVVDIKDFKNFFACMDIIVKEMKKWALDNEYPIGKITAVEEDGKHKIKFSISAYMFDDQKSMDDAFRMITENVYKICDNNHMGHEDIAFSENTFSEDYDVVYAEIALIYKESSNPKKNIFTDNMRKVINILPWRSVSQFIEDNHFDVTTKNDIRASFDAASISECDEENPLIMYLPKRGVSCYMNPAGQFVFDIEIPFIANKLKKMTDILNIEPYKNTVLYSIKPEIMAVVYKMIKFGASGYYHHTPEEKHILSEIGLMFLEFCEFDA